MNHITFFITGNCNLSCAYCFENTHHWPRCDTNPDVIKKSIDFLIAESGENEKQLQIGFFGGEPLLRPDLVDMACEYSKAEGEKHGKVFNYSITTNMTLIDEKVIEILKKHNITLLASVDGMPHRDNVRYWKGTQKSSATTALSNLLLAQKHNINIGIRWTVAPEILEHLAEDVITLATLGFRNLAVEFVYETRKWTEEDYKKLEAELRIIAEFYISELRAGRNLYVKPICDGFGTYTAENRPQYRCGLGYNGVGVASDGDIQPCHRFVARQDHKDWSLGNVLTEFDREKRDAMVSGWSYDKIKVDDGRSCKDCPIKIRCPGGSCFPVHLDACNDFYTTPHCYCDLQLLCQRVSNDVLGILYGEKNPIIMGMLGQNAACNCQ